MGRRGAGTDSIFDIWMYPGVFCIYTTEREKGPWIQVPNFYLPLVKRPDRQRHGWTDSSALWFLVVLVVLPISWPLVIVRPPRLGGLR